MKNSFLAFLIAIPLAGFAQLDKLRPGMPIQEFHLKFASAIPDLEAMTCRIYKKDTLLGVVGESQFTAVKDSVNSYFFTSEAVNGPSAEFPKVDSTDLTRLLRTAQQLMGHYSDIFGTPTKVTTNSARSPIIGNTDPNVFSASWKKPDGTVYITVHQVREIENMINAPANASGRDKKKGASYVMEIAAAGSWSRLRIDFEIGVTKNQFRALMPALASQVKDFPDCWTMSDTLAGRDANWHFWFVDNLLIGFSFDSYAGDGYGGSNKLLYPILLSKAKKFQAEEENSYGKATELQAPPTDAYTPVKKVPNAFFYDDVYYNAEWKMDKGKTLFIRLHENGGKGPSFLHLEVFYGEKED